MRLASVTLDGPPGVARLTACPFQKFLSLRWTGFFSFTRDFSFSSMFMVDYLD
jgi:hypothetical protein